ncbi:hypothetical protein [Tetragenococcus halophilus]|uniref:hypothetical protein n=1 Tax=Tetragenococcus halophilus TaxID=51669 RepID=UPI00209ADC62|nr:hypothetical protein [Tetragenococcus halophilus]MCO8286688.1 hypothetical protein [Tetragenococcus halophilus]MCO8288316.1 hypothetical protein [Tetragenococcus halophilus]MCO8294698.1 hypothetical protein [Tetragenococcus halophilus]
MNQEQTISKEQYVNNQLADQIAVLSVEKAQLQAENILLSQRVTELTKNDEEEKGEDE